MKDAGGSSGFSSRSGLKYAMQNNPPSAPSVSLSGKGGHFSGFPQLSAYLDELGLFRMKPGFDRVHDVIHRLGLDTPPFCVVQVVGTNGKGSTSTMLASLGQAYGLRVGLHRSPHLVSVRERVLINDAMLSEDAWVALGNSLMRHEGEQLSYFEFVTCLAMLAFAVNGVELAVMETGLGGTFDATTALHADMLAFTPIALDHQAVLGPTLRDIAADKAGAMRPGKPAWTVPQRPEAREELTRVAWEKRVPLHEVDADALLPVGLEGKAPPFLLQGTHQQENARLALAVWRALTRDGALPESAKRKIQEANMHGVKQEREALALADAWLPGRFHQIPPKAAATASPDEYLPCPLGWPPLLLDGAHNCHGLAALGLSLGKAGIAPAAVIFSCLADKEPDLMIPHLRAMATGPIFVPPVPHNPRAMPPEELAAMIGLNAEPVASLKEALERASAYMAERLPEAFTGSYTQNPLLICGSLYLLGEFYALRPDCLTRRP